MVADSLALSQRADEQGHCREHKITGYTRAWIGQIAKRYNEQGPDAMVNRRHTTSWRAPRMLSTEQQEELRQTLARVQLPTGRNTGGHATSLIGWRPSWAVQSPPSAAGTICNGSSRVSKCRGRSTRWLIRSSKRPSKKIEAAGPGGRHRVSRRSRRVVGDRLHRRAAHRLKAPAPTRVGRMGADRPAANRHGTAPLCLAPSALSRRLCPSRLRSQGRTFFHIATTVSIPVFEVELAEFARQAGASPTKQIVLMLDRAGWRLGIRV